MTKEQIQSLKDFIEEQEPTMEAYSIVIVNSKQEASVHNDAQFGQLCLILKVLDAMIISSLNMTALNITTKNTLD